MVKRDSGKPSNQTDKSQKIMVDRVLLENMVSMQKVYSIIAEKLDRVSNQLSTLLSLFETAAKSFAENPTLQLFGRDKEFVDKINKLLEQDKIIARTLVMMQNQMVEKQAVQTTPVSTETLSEEPAAPYPDLVPKPSSVQPQKPQQK